LLFVQRQPAKFSQLLQVALLIKAGDVEKAEIPEADGMTNFAGKTGHWPPNDFWRRVVYHSQPVFANYALTIDDNNSPGYAKFSIQK